jgi:hypothetical protein
MNTQANSSQEGQQMGALAVTLLGIYYMVLSVFLAYLLVRIWPVSDAEIEKSTYQIVYLFRGLLKFSISKEIRLILIVMAAGGLGSFIHGATSLISYVGNRKIVKSWTWWYILRPFIGSVLALIFYFAIRGGFLSVTAGTEAISHFGIAATAGIVGMFSKEATDKLHEIFVTLFRPKDQRTDKLSDSNQ